MWEALKEKRLRRRHERALNAGHAQPKNRRYRFFQIGFFVLLLGYGGMVWLHWDYWVFRLLISGNYIFTEDLDELYGRHILEENRRSFQRDFDRVMISVFTEAIREVNADRFTYLYSPQAHIAVREREEAVGRSAEITALTDTTVYVWVPNMSRWSRDYIVENREYLSQYENIVLDLRNNRGGMLRDFRRIAELFLPRGVVLGHEDTRWNLFTRTHSARGRQQLEFENFIILQNRRTASAAESLIQALDYHLPHLVTLGEITYGKGIGQVTVPLTQGYAVRASVLVVSGPDGEVIHNVGLEPYIAGDAERDWVEQALSLIYD